MKNRNKNFDAELAALTRKRDEDIDTSDIPEVKDGVVLWSENSIDRSRRQLVSGSTRTYWHGLRAKVLDIRQKLTRC